MNMLISKQMKYFITTVQERSFTRAAEKLYITRSPLTKIISEMEEILGQKLFLRKYNDLEPTPFALELFSKIHSTYNYLLGVEEFIFNNQNIPEKFKFDYSIPQYIFEHISAAVSFEFPGALCIREHLATQQSEIVNNLQNDIIISHRQFKIFPSIQEEKWQHDGFVFVRNNSMTTKGQPSHLLIYKDKFTHMIKSSFLYYFQNEYAVTDLVEHDFDITKLLYYIKTGRYHSVMSSKMASAYRGMGIRYEPAVNIPRNVYIYFQKDGPSRQKIEMLKYIINMYL